MIMGVKHEIHIREVGLGAQLETLKIPNTLCDHYAVRLLLPPNHKDVRVEIFPHKDEFNFWCRNDDKGES